jgi:hypothetical protein
MPKEREKERLWYFWGGEGFIASKSRERGGRGATTRQEGGEIIGKRIFLAEEETKGDAGMRHMLYMKSVSRVNPNPGLSHAPHPVLQSGRCARASACQMCNVCQAI